MRELSGRPSTTHRAALLSRLRATGDQGQTSGGGPCRTLHIFDQTTEAISFGITNANRSVENLFRDFSHAAKQGATTSQHYTAGKLSFPTSVFDLVCDVHQNLFSPWLQNVTKNLPRELTWRASSDGRHID